MSPLLAHLSLALSKLQAAPCCTIPASTGHEVLARWIDLAAVLPPRTSVPASAHHSVRFLYALLGQVVPDGMMVHQGNAILLQARLAPFAGRPDLAVAVLDILVATLREIDGAENCLTPRMVRDLRHLAARLA